MIETGGFCFDILSPLTLKPVWVGEDNPVWVGEDSPKSAARSSCNTLPRRQHHDSERASVASFNHSMFDDSALLFFYSECGGVWHSRVGKIAAIVSHRAHRHDATSIERAATHACAQCRSTNGQGDAKRAARSRHGAVAGCSHGSALLVLSGGREHHGQISNSVSGCSSKVSVFTAVILCSVQIYYSSTFGRGYSLHPQFRKMLKNQLQRIINIISIKTESSRININLITETK